MVVLAFVVVAHHRDGYVCWVGARIAAVGVFRVVVSHCIIWRVEGDGVHEGWQNEGKETRNGKFVEWKD